MADMRSRRIYGDAQAACMAAFVEFMFKKKGMAFLYGKKPFILTGQNIIYVTFKVHNHPASDLAGAS